MENLVVGKEYFKVEHDVIYRIKVSGKTKKGNYKYHKTKPFEGGGILTATDQVLDKLDKAQMKKLVEREKEKYILIEHQKNQERVWEEKRTQIYAFLDENKEKIRELCYEKARELKPYAKNECIDDIAAYCKGTTQILEWHPDPDRCVYNRDRSGYVKSTNDVLTLNNTVNEVVYNYTGKTSATYLPGCGLSYDTINDDIKVYYESIVIALVLDIMKEYIKDNAKIEYNEYFDTDDIHTIAFERDDIWCDIMVEIRFEIGYDDAETLLDGIDFNMTVKELLSQKTKLPDNNMWPFLVFEANF